MIWCVGISETSRNNTHVLYCTVTLVVLHFPEDSKYHPNGTGETNSRARFTERKS